MTLVSGVIYYKSVHPGRWTWNLKIGAEEEHHLPSPVIFAFKTLNLRGCNLNVSTIWVFQKIMVPPQIIHFNRVFHYKPSILGYPYFWKHPFWGEKSLTFHHHLGWLSSAPRCVSQHHGRTSRKTRTTKLRKNTGTRPAGSTTMIYTHL